MKLLPRPISFFPTPPPSVAYLEKRKGDKTITITTTLAETITEKNTIFINQTITSHLATTIWSTRDVTHFIPTTIVHNMTLTTTTPMTISISAPAPNTDTRSSIKSTQAGENASGSSSSTPPAVAAQTQQHHLSTVAILGIVFGALALVGLLVAGLWLVRRFYRMYRRERVLRKQIQCEGNEMPGLKTGVEGK
ncbi:hypothetical protein ACLMJK_003916 [Lecanora helva]